MRELLMRQRVRRIVVAAPPSVVLQWKEELDQRFGLTFVVFDRDYLRRMRMERGFAVNPWTTHSRFIVSHHLLRDEDYASTLRAWLDNDSSGSLLILDEAHNAAPASGAKYAVDSQFTKSIRELYLDIAARIANPAPPRLCNTDGDPLVLTSLTFTVEGTVDEVARHLIPLALLPGPDPDEEVLDEFERDGTGALTSATLSWKKAGNKKHKQWSNTILGTIRLTAGRIVAEVNSEKRARRCARELKKLLGSSVTLISSEATDIPTTLKKRPAAPPEVRAPELVAMEEELFKQHMDAWIDTKVPALGNRTPRVVARTALGRERLAALVSTFERGQVERLPNGRALLNELRVKLGLDLD